MPQNIQILIKPASSKCNEHCTYCFYADEAKRRQTADCGLMQHDVAQSLIKRAFEYADESCDFIFQGGEPMLAGLDFFRSFVSTANQLNQSDKDGKLHLSWSIQSNGSLIDEDAAKFFKDNNFLVGISLDGPKEIHDRQRGSGSFDRAMSGITALKKQGADYNILSVVTKESSEHAKEIYEFFKSQGFHVQQYIPCLSPLGENWSNDFANSWGHFLCDLYDIWEEDIKRGENISIRYFENIARVLLGLSPESCGMAGRCTLQFTVESDGSVYPCDFYVLDEYKLGNIKTLGFNGIEKSANASEFIKPNTLHSKCNECKYYLLCQGGCKRERDINNSASTGLCEGYQMFFEHSVDRLWSLLKTNYRS